MALRKISFFRGIALAGILTAAATAHGETASLEASVAPIQKIFPNAYGVATLRHYLEKEGTSSSPSILARYTLGSTFFDKKLDSYFRFSVKKKPQSSIFETQNIAFENYFTLFSNDFFEIQPLAELSIPKNGGGAKSLLGNTFTAKYSQSFAQGKLDLISYLRTDSAFGTNKENAPKYDVLDREHRPVTMGQAAAFGLAGADAGSPDTPYTATSTKPAINNELSFGVAFTPALVKGLKIAVDTHHYKTFNPKMELDENAKSFALKTSSNVLGVAYTTSLEKETRFAMKYDFNDSTSLLNEFFLQDRKQGETQYLNTLTLSTKVF